MTPTATKPSLDPAMLSSIADRAFAQMVHMIWEANHRADKRPGDPKVGGHPAACASALHILGALHLAVREPHDYVCCKPHGAPMDHAYHHLMGLFRREDGSEDGSWFTADEAKKVMSRLRMFPEPDRTDVFQSYHARSDPDSFHYLPSGSVGIPPVVSVYLALAHRYMEDHGMEVPGSHFWSLIGDSEFREGSLLEAMPDVSERLLGNVTWIIDYNRQNLDGTRIPNSKGLHSRDCDRIERTALANGWQVMQVRHGSFRDELFERKGGESLRDLFENTLSDYEYQLALFKYDALVCRTLAKQHSSEAHRFLKGLSDEDVLRAFCDVGGHDMGKLINALTLAKADPCVPYLLIVHTIKGFGMKCFADPSNHSSLPEGPEVEGILERHGLTKNEPYELFPETSEAGAYLKERGRHFRGLIMASRHKRREKRQAARRAVEDAGGLPDTLDIDMSLYPSVHTQWMWGQIAAKLVRISTSNEGGPGIGGTKKKPLSPDEKRWASVADFVLTMSPDVGTSTNIAPVLDRRVYGPGTPEEQKEGEFKARHPELMSHSEPWTRHIRFEIAEANCMSAAGSFGKMAHYTGNPSFPIMTVYDFFVKRALDQLYYNLYWGSEFVIIGTPSGVTLSPEGAQHSWKSDIQIPNLITWEPCFALEMDWILADAIQRHMLDENDGRRGVLIRAVTRAIEQRLLLDNLRTQARFKTNARAPLKPAGAGDEWGSAVDEATVPPKSDEDILAALRLDVLAGAYYLVDWRGYAGYEPGDNVVHIFSMGSLTTEALEASQTLLERGVFANIIVISSPELLLGILGEQSNYRHLRKTMEITGNLHAVQGAGDSAAGLVSIAGRRVPCVAICDGEAGLVDNIGSIVGVKQITLAVRRFSKCGRPDQVFRYQNLHAEAIVEAAGKALSETALESLQVSPSMLQNLNGQETDDNGNRRTNWRELWPSTDDTPSCR
ncbi:MAG: pyruvate dehydrogenase [Planctomycetes bacterium]|nr:pyruvate dehydrogenase [Planctomycetota bacterium]